MINVSTSNDNIIYISDDNTNENKQSKIEKSHLYYNKEQKHEKNFDKKEVLPNASQDNVSFSSSSKDTDISSYTLSSYTLSSLSQKSLIENQTDTEMISNNNGKNSYIIEKNDLPNNLSSEITKCLEPENQENDQSNNKEKNFKNDQIKENLETNSTHNNVTKIINKSNELIEEKNIQPNQQLEIKASDNKHLSTHHIFLNSQSPNHNIQVSKDKIINNSIVHTTHITTRKKISNKVSIIKISPKTKTVHNKILIEKNESLYSTHNNVNQFEENQLDELSPFNDKEKAYQFYVDSAFNGDVNCQKAAARCCMLGIGTDKNYRKACQFLKAAAHQKDVESMVSLAEGYGNGLFPLQEEYSDEEDYPDEVSSESDESIKFSSDSSFSSDGSYLSDDNRSTDNENDHIESFQSPTKSSNQLVPNIEKTPVRKKIHLQVLPSPSKSVSSSPLSNNRNILITPTKSNNNTSLSPKFNIKKVYRKKISLLNSPYGIHSPTIQRNKTLARNWNREKRKNKYLNKKRKFSFHYRKMAAKYGHLSSIKFIAKAYDFGLEDMNILPNSHLAQKYYIIAAKEYEDIDSLRRLGDMYYYHDEKKQNSKNKSISFNYYQKAALLGDLKSSERVAHCLYYGEGIPQNIQHAYKLLLDIAEKNSDGQLMKYIGDEYYYGSDTSISITNKKKDQNSKEQLEQTMIKPDISLAFEYYYKAIKMKDASACKTVGNHHFLGIPKYLKSNPKKAVEYYEQAVDLGDYSVIKLIADCYLFGIGVKRNIDKAKLLYDKLKENGLWEGEMPSPDTEIDLDF